MKYFLKNNATKHLNKKAQLEMQINWIYVLIVGAVILAFFFLLANSQKKSADESLAYTISKNMEYILTVTKSNTDSATPVQLYGSEMHTSCSDGFSKITIDKASSDLAGMIVFSPYLLQGEQVQSWTQSWFAPYKIDNFVYISSPKTLYYIVYNGTSNAILGNKINKSVPAIFNIYLDNKLDWKNFYDDNYDNIKVIFLGVSKSDLQTINGNPSTPIRFPNIGTAKFSVISIESFPNTNDEIGKVFYYSIIPSQNNRLDTVSSDINESRYYGFASLLASIFSEDQSSYECGLLRAFSKMKVENAVLLNRTEYLLLNIGDPSIKAPPVVPSRCSSSLSQTKLALSNIDTVLKSKTKVIDIADALKVNWESLDYHNDALEAASCPLTY